MQCIVDIFHQFDDSFCARSLRSRNCSNGGIAEKPTETSKHANCTLNGQRLINRYFFCRFYSDLARPSQQAVGQVCRQWLDRFETHLLRIFCCIIVTLARSTTTNYAFLIIIQRLITNQLNTSLRKPMEEKIRKCKKKKKITKIQTYCVLSFDTTRH